MHIISSLCGWDRLAQAFSIYLRLNFLIVSVGSFLIHFIVLFPQDLYYSRRRVLATLSLGIMCGIGSILLLLDLAHDGVDVKQSCAIVAAVYLLFFALVWYAVAETATNTPSEPKRKVIPVDDAAQLV